MAKGANYTTHDLLLYEDYRIDGLSQVASILKIRPELAPSSAQQAATRIEKNYPGIKAAIAAGRKDVTADVRPDEVIRGIKINVRALEAMDTEKSRTSAISGWVAIGRALGMYDNANRAKEEVDPLKGLTISQQVAKGEEAAKVLEALREARVIPDEEGDDPSRRAQ